MAKTTKKKAVKKTAKKVVKKVDRPLTKIEEKRVAILKDAIQQIKLEKYTVTSGTYVDSNLDRKVQVLANYNQEIEYKDNSKTELKNYLDKIVTVKNPCEVCAKGAILLSSIRKYNNLSLEEASDCDLSDIASDKARDILGEVNADTIEDFFELSNMNNLDNHNIQYDSYGEPIPSTYENLIDKWANKYPSAEDRLIAIFNNATSNRGVFKPGQLR